MRPKLHLFDKTLKVHQWLKLPAMTFFERKLIKKILLGLGSQQPLNIFEYGSGYSTLYYAQFLRNNGIRFHLDTIDNHEGWHRRVGELISQARLNSEVTQHLCAFPPCWEKPGWDWAVEPPCGKFAPQSPSELEYVQKPALLGKRFDLIIVDARFRRRCLEVSLNCLKPNGIVVLHDAEKTKYHEPLKKFKYAAFLNSGPYYPFERMNHRIWIGSPDNLMVKALS